MDQRYLREGVSILKLPFAHLSGVIFPVFLFKTCFSPSFHTFLSNFDMVKYYGYVNKFTFQQEFNSYI